MECTVRPDLRWHMILTGTYDLAIDPKNRLSIPFMIRRKLCPQEHGIAFYALPGRTPGTLALYPEKTYEAARANEPPDDQLSDDEYAWRQFMYSQTALLDPDSQGRILIPQRLLEQAGLEKEVVMTGVKDHLELWRRDAFATFTGGMWSQYTERRPRAVHGSVNPPGQPPAASATGG